jgi:hypothetical protein
MPLNRDGKERYTFDAHWPRKKQGVHTHVMECDECQKRKQTQGGRKKTREPTIPFEITVMDIYGP